MFSEGIPTGVPTLASDFSLGGRASLPVALSRVSRSTLCCVAPRELKHETTESVAVRRGGEHVWVRAVQA